MHAAAAEARDLARRTPDSVRQVITLGSPFRLAHGGQSRATKVFERYSHLHVEHRTLPLESETTPLPVPSTSIYSHLDGIVHWSTCLDTPGEHCENIAVMASHLGLGHHPAAIYAIADERLVWAGRMTATNPKSLRVFLDEMVKEGSKELKRQKLI